MGVDWFNCERCGEITNDCSSGCCCCCGDPICESCCENERKERLIKPPLITGKIKDNEDTSEFCCYGEDNDGGHDKKHSECCFKIGCILCTDCEKRLQRKKDKLDGRPDICKWCKARKDISKIMKKYEIHDSHQTQNVNLCNILNDFCNNGCVLKDKEWLKENRKKSK